MDDTGKTGMTLKHLAENVGLEEDEYLQLLQLFIETSMSYLGKMKSAIRVGDAKIVYEMTHSIRGAAENLGIPEISEIAKAIELRARQNILEGAEDAAESLAKELDVWQKYFI